MPSSEKPETDIIEDDERLDQWYTQYSRNIAIRSSRSNGQRFDMSESEKMRSIPTFGAPDAQEPQAGQG